MHGLLDGILASLESKRLSSGTSRGLAVSGEREEGSKLIPSETKLLIQGVASGFVTTNISTTLRNAEHRGTHHALKTVVHLLPGSEVRGVSH